MKFLDGLKEYDKDNIPGPVIKKVREKFIKNPEFDPAIIKNVSTACEGLCKWVKAMEVYDRVIKIVEPKKLKLAEAENELQSQMDKLNEKRAQLQQVTDKLQALNDEYAAMNKKKKDLEDNIELCSQKLERAEKLIGTWYILNLGNCQSTKNKSNFRWTGWRKDSMEWWGCHVGW